MFRRMAPVPVLSFTVLLLTAGLSSCTGRRSDTEHGKPGAKQVYGGEEGSMKPTSAADDSPYRDSVVASLDLGRRVFRVDEPIGFSFRITNRSDTTITIWLSGFWSNHLIMVRDETGIEPPLTKSGRLRRDAFHPPFGERSKNVPQELAPGASHVTGQGDLATLYRLTPGQYTLKVTYDDRRKPTPLSVAAPEVHFRVAAMDEK